jgi:hypothetical protein
VKQHLHDREGPLLLSLGFGNNRLPFNFWANDQLWPQNEFNEIFKNCGVRWKRGFFLFDGLEVLIPLAVDTVGGTESINIQRSAGFGKKRFSLNFWTNDQLQPQNKLNEIVKNYIHPWIRKFIFQDLKVLTR